MFGRKFLKSALILAAVLSGATSPVISQEKSTDEFSKIDVLRRNVDKIGPNVDRSGLTTGAVMRDSEMLSYCINISDAATEARNSILKKKLLSIETDVDGKLLALADKIEELEMWSKRREEFLNSVNVSLVKIFETMRPDAAALQFTEIGPAISSAIILKLDPKISSAILTEMSPADAAKVAIILTSALEVDNVQTE